MERLLNYNNSISFITNKCFLIKNRDSFLFARKKLKEKLFHEKANFC